MKTITAWAIKTARGKIATERLAWGIAYVITRNRGDPWRQGEKAIRVEIRERKCGGKR